MMKYKKIIIIFLALSLIAFILIGLPMSPRSYAYQQTMIFDKEGFVSASDLENQEVIVSENDNFILTFDETTSYFSVLNKQTNYVWHSNPTQEDPWKEEEHPRNITPAAENRQKATLEISYSNLSGSNSTINNYRRSINHPKTLLYEEGMRTYSIKYVPNGVQVLYRLEDLEVDYSYFPRYMDRETLDALEQARTLKSYYEGYDESLDAYFIQDYAGLSQLARGRLYDIFYGQLAYTHERATQENQSYGYFETVEKTFFEIAIQIELKAHGVEVKLIRNSIVESPNVRISEIILFPLFGTAVAYDENGEYTEGYIVLPDGSGSVIEFNNGKYNHSPFRKRVYGTDLSMLPFRMAEQQQNITMPIYGMSKEDDGFLAIITEGDAMASIHADTSERVDSYNKVYTSFNLRESEAVVLGSGYSRYGVNLFTKDIVSSDFAVNYHFLSGTENSYAGMARTYRNYLLETFDISPRVDTQETKLTLELIGAYDYRDFLLGIPYTNIGSMTTFKQAQYIIDLLRENGVIDMNVSYLGAANGGLSNNLFDRNNMEGILGGNQGYQNLQTYLESLNIEIYQHATFTMTHSYRGMIDSYRYTASRIRGSNARYFNYHYPTRLSYSQTNFSGKDDAYLINPLYYETLYKSFNNNISHNLSMTYMGSSLVGHYEYNKTLYRQDAIKIQNDFLASVNEGLMLSNPLAFALPYAKYITNVPTETTLYALIDYQIPLIQLILSGIVPYGSESLNLSSDRSVDYQFLKLLETGSNPKYTLSHDDSSKLLNTDYNLYMSTYYVNWVDIISEQMNLLNELNLHQGYLENHVRLANNVYEVTYSSGLQIILNYNLGAVEVNGITIDSMDYFVSQEALDD